jgi:DNA-binding transcriptional MerR regulator
MGRSSRSAGKNQGAELLKIGAFARLAGTNLRTLRYYEELRLLRPAARSRGGFRYYRAADRNRLRLIRELQELGLGLEAIRGLLDTGSAEDGREAFFGRVRAALAEQDRLLSARMAELEAQRARIREGLQQVQACETCVHTPGEHNNHCEPCCLTQKPLPETVSALY